MKELSNRFSPSSQPKTLRLKKRSAINAITLAASALFTLHLSTEAAIKSWTGAMSTSWTAAGNWSGGAPANDLTSDIALFNQVTYTNNANGGTNQVYGIQVGDGATAATMTITGGSALSIGAGGITISANAGASSIGTPLRLGASQSWANNSSSLFTVGAFSNAGNVTPFTLTLNGSGSGNTMLSGVISNGGATGTTALAIDTTGGGVTTLSAVNTFTGGVTLTRGILRATTSASTLGQGALTLGGGELQLAHTSNLSFNRNTTVAGNTMITSDATAAGAGKSYTFGTLSLGAHTLTVKRGTNVTSGTAGVIFGATTLTGAGTFKVVNSSPDVTTLLTVGAIDTAGHLVTLDGDGSFSTTAIISGSGGLATAATFSGTATLGGANTFTGGVTLNGGTLLLTVNQALGNGTNDLVINGGTLDLGATSSIRNQTITSLSGSGGVISNDRTTGAATEGRLTISGSTNGTFGGIIQDGTAKTVSIIQAGTGTLTLTGSNSFTGGLTISSGAVKLGSTHAGGKGIVTVNADNSLIFEKQIGQFSIGSLSGSKNVVLEDTDGNGTALTLVGNSNGTYSSAVLSGAGSLVLNMNAQQTLAGATFTGGVTLNSGTLNLSSANNFSGGVTINGGMLRTAGNGALGTLNALTLHGGAFDMLGIDSTVKGLNGTGGTITSSHTSSNSTLTIDSATNSAFGGLITEGTRKVLIVKNGSGTQALTGTNNTYTGTTTITAGVLEVSHLADGGEASSIGSSNSDAANLVLNGGTLRYVGSGGSTNRLLSITTLAGSTLDASGTGAIAFTNMGAPVQGTSSFSRTLTLTGTNTGNNTLAWQIANAGLGVTSITKEGTGTWVLTGANTYTGATTITAGRLLVNGSLTSQVSVAAGATLGGSGRVGAISGGGLVSAGNSAGILTADSVDGSSGLDFNFEITQLGGPNYANSTASGNDLLRLTDATPFTMALSSANTITVDFSTISLTEGDVFRGGFFSETDFLSAIENANFVYLGVGSGLAITFSTVAESGNFSGGTVDGFVTEFTVVPEPSSYILLAAGGVASALLRRRKAA